jgi:chromosome segregation ATPase
MPERIKPVGDIIGQFGGWLVGFLAVVGTIFYNSRKVKVDESALILVGWKDLNETHKADMKALKEEIEKDRARYNSEMEALRARLREVETDFLVFRKEAADQILARELEIAGLKRAIAQNSQSTAVQIGRAKERANKAADRAEDAEGRIDHLTTDKNAAHDEIHDEINECIERLDRIGDNSNGKGEGE